MKRVLFLSTVLVFLSACSSEPEHHHTQSQGGRNGDVVSYAQSLLGTPYHYGGDSPSTGFDCSGFVRHVYYHTQGISLPHNAKGISQNGKPISASNLRPGDLVFYNTLGRSYSHVGIYIGSDRFIHSPHSGKTVEIVDMSQDYWRKRFNGARRIYR